jgi:hypothetical protein
MQLLNKRRMLMLPSSRIAKAQDATEHSSSRFDFSSTGLNTVISTVGGILKHSTQAASLNSSCATLKNKTSSVKFSTITISSHLIMLGNNPSSHGPPLMLSWKAMHTKTLTLEDYEDSRPVRRTRDQLLIPRAVREDWLILLGYSRADLKEAVQQAFKIKKSRAKNGVQHQSFIALLRWSGRAKS